jgi:hypothetical protein
LVSVTYPWRSSSQGCVGLWTVTKFPMYNFRSGIFLP